MSSGRFFPEESQSLQSNQAAPISKKRKLSKAGGNID